MNMVQCRYFLIFIILLCSHAVFAAPPDKEVQVKEALTKKFNQYRKFSEDWDRNVIREADRVIFSADSELILENLNPFLQDASPKIRHEAVSVLGNVGRHSQSPPLRRRVVERLMEIYYSGDDAYVLQSAYGQLFGFKAGDFSEQAKSHVRQSLAPRKYGTDTVLLAGIANVQDKIPFLKKEYLRLPAYKYLTPGEQKFFFNKAQWKIRLALARMGSREELEYCVNMVASWPDLHVRVHFGLQDLAYTRQPEAIRLIQTYLESDECFPTRVDAEGMCYAMIALNLLAPILEEFPAEYSPGLFYTQEDIEAAREWMKAQTTLKIKR